MREKGKGEREGTWPSSIFEEGRENIAAEGKEEKKWCGRWTVKTLLLLRS